ncbi:MAG: hypothetical protein ACRDRX_05660 [Pseudonocardiaceae bacterium]
MSCSEGGCRDLGGVIVAVPAVGAGVPGLLNRAAQYERSVAAAESLTSQLDSSDALLACGLLHLDAALAAGARADHDAATHPSDGGFGVSGPDGYRSRHRG